MAYTRAPPSFQARYFSFRRPPIASPLPFGASPIPSLPMPTTFALSLSLDVDFSYNASVRSVSPSNFRPTSPASSIIGSLTRISLITILLFSQMNSSICIPRKYLVTLSNFFPMPMRKMGAKVRQTKHVSQNYVKTLHICGDRYYTRISSSKYMEMYLL